MTGYRIKVVEQAGVKLLDRLHSSNPWRGESCGRTECWPCSTKGWSGTDKKKDCAKRSLVYETWCQTCFEREKEKIEEDMEEGPEREKRIEMIPLHKYIGETARSAYERGWEHEDALRKLDEDSHLVKHIANYHQEDEIDKIKFGMRIKQYTRTALERQVLESVLIQEESRRHKIMNSKSEYSRCTIPRLTTKMGTKEYDKQRGERIEEEREEEKRIRAEIGRRRKERCRKRNSEIHPEEQTDRENTQHKRRKVAETGEYKVVLQRKMVEREVEKKSRE